MNLDSFSGRDLQNFKAFLRDAIKRELSMQQLLTVVENQVQNGFSTTPAAQTMKNVCPYCSSRLVKCGKTNDIYCKKCRFSRLGGK